MEIKRGDAWLEVLGCGMVRGEVLKNFGIDPERYNGWAFGFGLERLAMISMSLPDIRLLWSGDERVKKQLMLDQPFQEVSKFPPITRDISFIVKKGFVPNEYFDVIRDIGGDLVEEVKLLDHYEDAEKFGADRESYTYRVVYRSNERTLVKEEVDVLQDKLVKDTADRFGAEIR
jgi:phenylalanyl-tRNA synthetase alpha chain